MPLNTDTAYIQSCLANFCRTGEAEPIPGARQDRLKEYRQLVYLVVNNTLEQAYPITFNYIKEEEWELMVTSFLKEHACQQNQVWKLPLEFYDYVKEKNFQETFNYPFLNELLYFEWLEIEIHTMPDVPYPAHIARGSFEHNYLVLNPEHKMILLSYPVHLMPVQQAVKNKGSYIVLLFRERETGRVKFMNISALHAYIIESLNNADILLTALLNNASGVFNIPNDKLLAEHVLLFLNDLEQQGMALGFKINN